MGENDSAVIMSVRESVASGDPLSDSCTSARVENVTHEAEIELSELTVAEELDRDLETELSVLRVAEELARDVDTELTPLAVVDITAGTCK